MRLNVLNQRDPMSLNHMGTHKALKHPLYTENNLLEVLSTEDMQQLSR